MPHHSIGLLTLSASLFLSTPLQAASANSKGFEFSTLDCQLVAGFTAKLDQARYRIGEGLVLEINPASEVFVTVLDHGSDPDQPHREHALYSNVRINKGSTYRFPDQAGKILRVSGPAGENTFEIITSTVRLKDPAAHSKNVNLEDVAEGEEDVKTSHCTLSFSITE